MTTLSTASADELRRRITGDIYEPGDAEYAGATLGWNRLFQHRPAIIGVPDSAADVVELLRYAQTSGMKVGVQATGHGPVLEVDGGMLILTKRLDDVSIDPDAATARVGAGATWGPVLAAAQEHGLAPLLGSSGTVGAVGYTLGGGFGWLGRKYGMSSDSVRSFEVVTADGRIITASPSENAELFWGLRGGGAGSLAIVIAMEVVLHPVTTVYAGNLFYPASMAREVMARWREWTASAPDDLTSSVVLMNFPPFEDVPEPLRGQSFALVRGCHSGDLDDAVEMLQFWREWNRPAIDMWNEMPFAQADMISNDPVDPMPVVFSGAWLHSVDDATIESLIAATLPAGGPPTLVFAEIRHAAGAIADGDGTGSAYGNRDAQYLFSALGVGMTPDMAVGVRAHLDGLLHSLEGVRVDGDYLNFLDGDARRKATRRGVNSFDRLSALKRDLDPSDLMAHGLDLTT
jgi:hypothetical protein